MNADKRSVLTFGEALVGYASVEDNLRTATQFTRFPGGADLNVAVASHDLQVRTMGERAGRRCTCRLLGRCYWWARNHSAGTPSQRPDGADVPGGADGDPEVLQVRHHTAFAQHADALLTGDVLALEGIDHVHLTGLTLGISPVVRAVARCWRPLSLPR